jgi:di-N-acetylchitobiase
MLDDGAAKRRAWIQNALELVQTTHRDGIVFDYESPLPKGSAEGEVYAKLIADTRTIFHQVNPSYQISTCVPWSPHNIDGRAYPFRKIAKASDVLYVMDYDTRSQVFDTCIAGANAPLPGMIQGINEWMFDLGVPASKLVLGVPWYGYKYPCLPGTAADAIYCPIRSVPFRGVNCSDAVGSQVAHADAIKILQHGQNNDATGGLRRDDNTGSLFFNTVEGNVVYQYWIEDPVLLTRKFAWARENGLAGVGPFVFRNLDPVDLPDESIRMWSTFDEFIGSPIEATS